MKWLYHFMTLIFLSVIGIIASSCSPIRPEQLNFILQIDKEKPASLGEIVSAMANRAGMKVKEQDFDYGGSNGVQKAFLIFDSRISVAVSGTFDEDCHTPEGYREIAFSSSAYGVSIYRTSIFKPRMALQEVANVLGEEAKRRGGALVPESENCADIAPETSKNPKAR
jgi:hypothetical protein